MEGNTAQYPKPLLPIWLHASLRQSLFSLKQQGQGQGQGR